jgi:hypothetical protein
MLNQTLGEQEISKAGFIELKEMQIRKKASTNSLDQYPERLN